MVKKNHIIILIISVILLSFGFKSDSYAANSSEDVIVTYIPDIGSIEKFNLEVTVEGDGHLLDQGQDIGNKASYQLMKDEEQTFQIGEKDRTSLKSIVYDGQDVTELLDKNGSLIIKGKAYDTTLAVNFEKKKEGTWTDIVKTEDKTRIAFLVILAGGAVGIILKLTRRRHL